MGFAQNKDSFSSIEHHYKHEDAKPMEVSFGAPVNVEIK